jgi:hypothetical protein
MCVTTREILLKLRLMHCNHIIAEVEKMAWARRRDARVAAPFKWCIQLWGSRRSIIRSSSYSSSIYPCRRGTKMICQVWSRFSKYNFRMRFGLDPQDARHQQTNGHRGFFFFLSRNSTYVQSNWLVVSGLIYQYVYTRLLQCQHCRIRNQKKFCNKMQTLSSKIAVVNKMKLYVNVLSQPETCSS